MALLAPILPSSDEPLVKWGKLYGAAPALAIAEAALSAAGPLIVIAQSSREAEALSEEVRFFAGPNLNVRVFPDLETLPYDGFSAHPDITSARLATLAELPRARHGLIAGPKCEVSFDDPMANSSMFVLPSITAPAFHKFCVTVDS